jgi:hypothetical protein
MSKELFPRSFRFDKLVKSVGLTTVVGVIGFAPAVVRAQSVQTAAYVDNTSGTTSWTQPNTAPKIDYRILADPSYNYAQIARARAHGLSDRNVARAIGLADKADVPVAEIVDKLDDGWTFSTIASYYGVSNSYNDDSYLWKLQDYLVAYHSTGWDAVKRSSWSSGMTNGASVDSWSSSGGSSMGSQQGTPGGTYNSTSNSSNGNPTTSTPNPTAYQQAPMANGQGNGGFPTSTMPNNAGGMNTTTGGTTVAPTAMTPNSNAVPTSGADVNSSATPGATSTGATTTGGATQ